MGTSTSYKLKKKRRSNTHTSSSPVQRRLQHCNVLEISSLVGRTICSYNKRSKKKMRKKFNFGMVALVLLANSIFSATNARELPSFDSIKQFMLERLARRDNNEDIDMVPMTEVKRSDLCDSCAHVNLPTNKTCDTEWAPNYVTPEGETGCVCLKEYVCCPEPENCPELDEKACTKKGFVHGLHFLEKGKDCCQCPTTTCKPCPKPDLEEKLNCVPVCETYVERHHKHAVTGCWESACVKNPAPTPAPANCDDRCQEEVTRKDNCTHPYLACESKTAPLNCGPDEPDQRPCHEKPTKAFLSTFYYEGEKCEPCYEWSHPPSPHPPHVPVTCDSRCRKLVTKVDECGFTSDECEALVVPDSCKPPKPDPVECHERPEQQFIKEYYYGGSKCDTCWKYSMPKIPCPELTNTCHMHDGRTGICWDKGVGLTPDKCCLETKCFNKNEDCFQQFPKSESCSEGFQKFSGVSLCGLARDVCVECEKDWTLSEKDCPSSCYGKVTYKDRAGCQAQRCVSKACPSLTIPKCDNGKLGISKDACGCEQNFCDVNECSSKPCQNGATCVDKLNSYECICKAGYSGTLCETAKKSRSSKGSACSKLKIEANGDSNKRFKENRGSCYLFYPNSGLTWTTKIETARAYCQSLNADLVAVETSAENDFIIKTIDVTDTNMPNSQDYWILGAKTRANNEYYWVQTGNPITFADWNSRTNKGAYVVYMMTRSLSRKWNKYSGTEHNIICEGKM